MRELKKRSLDYDQLLLHRAVATPSHRCYGYRVVMGDRLPSLTRERCLQNESGQRCVAPPRLRGCRVSV